MSKWDEIKKIKEEENKWKNRINKKNNYVMNNSKIFKIRLAKHNEMQ